MPPHGFFVLSFGVCTSHSIPLCYKHCNTGFCATPSVFRSVASASDSIVLDSGVPFFHSPVRTTVSHFLSEQRPLRTLRLGKDVDIHSLDGGAAAAARWDYAGDREDQNSVVCFVGPFGGRCSPVGIRLLLRLVSLVRLPSASQVVPMMKGP